MQYAVRKQNMSIRAVAVAVAKGKQILMQLCLDFDVTSCFFTLDVPFP